MLLSQYVKNLVRPKNELGGIVTSFRDSYGAQFANKKVDLPIVKSPSSNALKRLY